MNQYKVIVNFKTGELDMSDEITLIKNDYNSTEFIFEFDIDGGKNVFELIKPDKTIFVKDIVDNKITLVDYDENNNPISLIPVKGKYRFEITHYEEDSKLTLPIAGEFYVEDEKVVINDSDIESSNSFPILTSLIKEVENMKTELAELLKDTTQDSKSLKALISEVEGKMANGDFNGQAGKDGIDGQAGYTPIRGTDYWTETDVNEIKKYCADYIDTKIPTVPTHEHNYVITNTTTVSENNKKHHIETEYTCEGEIGECDNPTYTTSGESVDCTFDEGVSETTDNIKTTTYTCTECGYSYQEQEEIPTTCPHYYQSTGKTTKINNDETYCYSKEYKCSLCGDVKEEKVEHDWYDPVEIDGYACYECKYKGCDGYKEVEL